MDTMWISKYALSGGVKEMVGVPASYSQEYFSVNGSYTLFKIGRDAHATEQEAIAAADAMRIKKIASLKKQIAKLEKLKF